MSGPPLIFEGNIKTTEHGKRSRGRPRKTWMLVQEDASPLTNDSTVTKDQLISRVQDRLKNVSHRNENLGLSIYNLGNHFCK